MELGRKKVELERNEVELEQTNFYVRKWYTGIDQKRNKALRKGLYLSLKETLQNIVKNITHQRGLDFQLSARNTMMNFSDISTSLNPQTDPTGKILCCECGILIQPNGSNMCVDCLANYVDISAGIPKQMDLCFCRFCERYLQPPGEWVHCASESRDLLAFCLKRLKGLKAVKLIDAGFVWTEPDSRRIKVKLTIHDEVAEGAVLQQVFIVEFVVKNQMCEDCHRIEAKDFWKCVVQIRQRAENKKSFFYLEQLILKHKAQEHTIGIKPIHGGLDFYYANENHARKMVEFLQTVLPHKLSLSKRLISQDMHSNISKYKLTFSIQIVPVPKHSLVCLSKKLQQHLGCIAPICLVQRVDNTVGIHLIDPLKGQLAEVNTTIYWRTPFEPICNPKQLVEYIIMDIEVIYDKYRNFSPGQVQVSNKCVLCDVWVVRASELGVNHNTIHTRTHLGHLLKVGDSALGYNLVDANINNEYFDKLNRKNVPDVILVKKFFGNRLRRTNLRNWKLKRLTEDANDLHNTWDYNEFLDDLEEDPDYRQHINIYRDTTIETPLFDLTDKGADDLPTITLAEMLEDSGIS